jgi:DNA-binding transcriptional LysR family regulator
MKADLRQLRHIAAVGDLRSFSKAAEVLHISQPALSRSVATFEAACGAKVFDRTSGGIVPTVFGSAVLAEAAALIAHADRFNRVLAERSNGRAGEVSFGVGPLPAGLILPKLLAHMANERPAVHVRVTIDQSSLLLSALERGQIEFCIFAKSLLPPAGDLKVETIGPVEMAYVVRAGHPLADKADIAPSDLNAYPLATGTPPKEFQFSELPNPTISCESFSVLHQATLESDMIWLTSLDLLNGEARQKFKPLTIEGWRGGRQDLALVSLRAATLSPLALEFISLILANGVGRAKS